MRKIKFVNDEYYHIFNRGIDKREIFLESKDYTRFIDYVWSALKGEAKPPLKRLSLTDLAGSVALICHCLNPNHFHFVLRQIKDGGITKFMHFLSTSYTMFFNTKYQRSGSLFQGPFKAIHLNSNEYLLWLSAYVNLNAQIHGIIKNAKEFLWCSYPDYLDTRDNKLCESEIVLKQFQGAQAYQKVAEEYAFIMKENKKLREYWLEEA
jgi:putative transposase